jgi:hypothetical protein
MENSEVNDYLDTLDETIEGSDDESVESLLGEEPADSEELDSAEFDSEHDDDSEDDDSEDDDSEDDEESEEDADDEDSDDDKDFETDSADFEEEIAAPQAPIVSMETLPITGEARVDDALGRLADLQGLPVHEHVDVFEDVQRRLHETLADLAGQ